MGGGVAECAAGEVSEHAAAIQNVMVSPSSAGAGGVDAAEAGHECPVPADAEGDPDG